jgi:hypothetical protein
MSVQLYRIKDWGMHFESHESRKYKRLDWVRIPNKHDGLGFRLVAAEKDGAALFGTWTLIVQVASKTGGYDSRGILSRDGQPLTSRDLEAMTGFPSRLFDRAFAFFSQPKIGWLLAEQWQTDLPLSAGTPGESPGTPGFSPGSHPLEKRREEKKREEEEGVCAAGAAPLDDSQWLESLKANPAYQGIDVDREYAKMITWCQTNKKQPNRRRFINWLNKCDRPMQTGAASRPAAPELSEPEAWKVYLKDNAGRISWAESAAIREWREVPRHWQASIIEGMRKRGLL